MFSKAKPAHKNYIEVFKSVWSLYTISKILNAYS